jgi:hypothetical protein
MQHKSFVNGSRVAAPPLQVTGLLTGLTSLARPGVVSVELLVRGASLCSAAAAGLLHLLHSAAAGFCAPAAAAAAAALQHAHRLRQVFTEACASNAPRAVGVKRCPSTARVPLLCCYAARAAGAADVRAWAPRACRAAGQREEALS